MTVYAGIAGELGFLRAEAEALMTATFTAYSPDGFTAVDNIQELAFANQGDTPGKVQGSSSSTADTATEVVTIGGVRRPVLKAGLHIPVSSPLPVAGDQGIGWEYECTAVGDPADASLVGRRYLVHNVPAKSFATARRLDVVEVS